MFFIFSHFTFDQSIVLYMELTEELYNQHYGMLYRIARNILKDEDDAKDAVHDTFIKFHKAEIDSIGNEKYLLIAILKNTSIDKWRTDRKKTQLDFDIEDEFKFNSDFDNKLIESFILEGISQLFPVQKQVFELRYNLEMKYADISKIVGINKQSVINAYQKAVEHVAQAVKVHSLDKLKNRFNFKPDRVGAKKKILDKKTGKIVLGVKAAASIIGVSPSTLVETLITGRHPRFKYI